MFSGAFGRFAGGSFWPFAVEGKRLLLGAVFLLSGGLFFLRGGLAFFFPGDSFWRLFCSLFLKLFRGSFWAIPGVLTRGFFFREELSKSGLIGGIHTGGSYRRVSRREMFLLPEEAPLDTVECSFYLRGESDPRPSGGGLSVTVGRRVVSSVEHTGLVEVRRRMSAEGGR